MSAEELATGLMANKSRVEAQQILRTMQAHQLAESPETPVDLMRLAGRSDDE